MCGAVSYLRHIYNCTVLEVIKLDKKRNFRMVPLIECIVRVSIYIYIHIYMYMRIWMMTSIFKCALVFSSPRVPPPPTGNVRDNLV